ncbi:hypothetical protein [Paenibacillus nasutitermitis]|uniref:hypothetical protein n=1 Tax=Paenibacillus nasutitermitis TaxID=1652958 RepID=UPI00166E0218|nr:hypothetical protein [Paenibacillus nasutitermitis]
MSKLWKRRFNACNHSRLIGLTVKSDLIMNHFHLHEIKWLSNHELHAAMFFIISRAKQVDRFFFEEAVFFLNFFESIIYHVVVYRMIVRNDIPSSEDENQQR